MHDKENSPFPHLTWCMHTPAICSAYNYRTSSRTSTLQLSRPYCLTRSAKARQRANATRRLSPPLSWDNIRTRSSWPGGLYFTTCLTQGCKNKGWGKPLGSNMEGRTGFLDFPPGNCWCWLVCSCLLLIVQTRRHVFVGRYTQKRGGCIAAHCAPCHWCPNAKCSLSLQHPYPYYYGYIRIRRHNSLPTV